MPDELIVIEAKDCLPFGGAANHGMVIQEFVKQAETCEVFHFLSAREDDRSEIAHFDLYEKQWRAGRLVGEAEFAFQDKPYKISIIPRFGEQHLFRMLSEIFNIRFTDASQTYDKAERQYHLIRRLISFMWLNLLSKANRHGLPRVSDPHIYKGTTIRGRLNVRKSILPVKTEKQAVSTYSSNRLDQSISMLLKRAFLVLTNDYSLNEIRWPYNAQHAINLLLDNQISDRMLSGHEFQSIKYNELYKSFKPVLDLSWDIVKNHQNEKRDDGKIRSLGFFIDMAEIWELYLKTLLTKALRSEGWHLVEEELFAYPGKKFERKMIPDIIFKKDNKVAVFDAKYKLMRFRQVDYDRSDFYQIHSYVHFLQQKYDVLVGGLLYPLSESFDKQEQMHNYTDTLFSLKQGSTGFLVDGVDLSYVSNVDSEEVAFNKFREMEDAFTYRIISELGRKEKKIKSSKLLYT